MRASRAGVTQLAECLLPKQNVAGSNPVSRSIFQPGVLPPVTTPANPPVELPRTITVTGTGRASVRPDIADLRLGVTITEPTVDAARDASAEALGGVLSRLKGLGVEDRDLRTSIVSVQPQYDYSQQNAPPRLVGYQFTNLVAATIREIDKVGDAIDRALGAGATTIDQISFRVEDQSAAEKEAREAAVADARLRADTLAAVAGVMIAGVAGMVEGGGGPIPYPGPFERAAFAVKDAGTPVEAGMNEITATVTVTYLIAPKG